jgi:hypothetical protein
MSTAGYNPTTTTPQVLPLNPAVRGGASWFVTVAALSLVNSVLAMTGTGVRFIFGLGLTQFVDALAHPAGGTGMVLDLVINGFIAAIFVLFWHFARQGQKWAFLGGMFLYVLDALLLLVFKDWLSLAFHGYALYRMFHGYQALSTD